MRTADTQCAVGALLEASALRSVAVMLPATAMRFLAVGEAHEPVSLPQVDLRAGEVLVEVELATVCGSDVHTVLGHRTEPMPLVLGHEAVGRVVALGPAVEVGASPAADGSLTRGAPRTVDGAELSIGDRVVWSIAVHCGACDRCERGLTQKCRSLKKYGHERFSEEWALSGGFASHVHLLAGTPIVRVADDVPAAVLAPAGCGIATAWAALAAAERSVSLAGSSVLITGGGLIGLAACAMATARGASVTVSDPDAGRRMLAEWFGAAATHDPAQAQPPHGFDVALDASGAPAAVATGLDALEIGGVAVWVGSVFPTRPIEVVPERVVRGLITVTGVHNYGAPDLAGAVRFLEEHWRQVPFAELVGRTYPLAEIDSALARAAEHREVRVGVVPD